MRDVTIKGAFVSDYGSIRSSEDKLLGGYCCTDILQPLEYSVYNLYMLPNKVLDSLIVWNGLVQTVWMLIASGNRFDWKVINEGVGKTRDLILQDKWHISLIDLYCIHVFHRDCGEVIRTHGTVESHKVLGLQMKWALVVSGEQVYHPIHCESGEGFHKVFNKWGCGWVTDCDCIERLKIVDELERFIILLEYAKPARAICGSGRLIDTRCDAVFDYHMILAHMEAITPKACGVWSESWQEESIACQGDPIQ